ncbi:hypothetical protein K1719_017773 [Acacia pycnantha]|nr:hypothetical protein K1719_017773 [Acacia pycnantha]
MASSMPNTCHNHTKSDLNLPLSSLAARITLTHNHRKNPISHPLIFLILSHGFPSSPTQIIFSPPSKSNRDLSPFPTQNQFLHPLFNNNPTLLSSPSPSSFTIIIITNNNHQHHYHHTQREATVRNKRKKIKGFEEVKVTTKLKNKPSGP